MNQRAGPVYADFTSGRTAHRHLHGHFDSSSPIVRACSISGKPISSVRILDATAGLGVDAFTLASLGFNVTVVERDIIIYALLADAFHRAKQVRLIFHSFMPSKSS